MKYREYRERDNVASVVTPQEKIVTFFQADVEIYTPAPTGGSYVEHVTCKHQHTTQKAAMTCGRGLARKERAKRVANGAKPL